MGVTGATMWANLDGFRTGAAGATTTAGAAGLAALGGGGLLRVWVDTGGGTLDLAAEAAWPLGLGLAARVLRGAGFAAGLAAGLADGLAAVLTAGFKAGLTALAWGTAFLGATVFFGGALAGEAVLATGLAAWAFFTGLGGALATLPLATGAAFLAAGLATGLAAALAALAALGLAGRGLEFDFFAGVFTSGLLAACAAPWSRALRFGAASRVITGSDGFSARGLARESNAFPDAMARRRKMETITEGFP